uniref:Orf5 protein n=1 Tax=Aggregatibacter actinomycetemcomitans TaxID=714 RepID=Q9JRS0_AGGAC|nr:orf5 [Aggregatibacter actinomycetemcomitans]
MIKINMQKVSISNKWKFILVFLIIQLPFQNFFLNQTSLGIIGTNLSIFSIYLSFLFICICDFKHLIFIRLIDIFLLFFLIIISLVGILCSDFTYKDHNLFIKMINNFIIYSQPLIVFLLFNYIFKTKIYLLKTATSTSFYVFIILFLYLILCKFEIFSLDNNKILHGVKNYNMRLRLFSMESSHAITTYITFGLVSFLVCKSLFSKLFILVLLICGSLLIQSKGGILSFILSVLFILFLYITTIKKMMFILFISVITIMLLDITMEDIHVMISSFDEYTSITTRATLIIASLFSLFLYPFGFGFGAYLEFFDKCIIYAIDNVDYIFSMIGLSGNYSEINSYLYDASNYSTKSFFFDLIIYFGWVGLFSFMFYHCEINNKITSKILKVLFVFLVVSQITYVDSVYLYNFWFVFALMYNYWRIYEKKYISNIK